MTDITKCKGSNEGQTSSVREKEIDCPLKENCYRYKAKGGEYQSYFMDIPYERGHCKYFWGIE
jgi:hypothetical protein